MALPTVTQTFAGVDAGFYISAALKQANSLEYLTMMENIKYKSAIQKLDSTGAVQDATCDFTKGGTLTLKEAILEPKNLEVNLEICRENLLSSWTALTMRAGAGGNSPSFDEYVISYMASTIGQATENSIWGGAAAVGGEFEGFVTAATGLLVVDATVNDVANSGGAGVAYLLGDIVTNLENATAAIPAAVYMKEDLYIYMSPGVYRLYLQVQATAGYQQLYNMGDGFVPMFNGIKIAVCNGMTDKNLVVAERSNLFFGTDLISDGADGRGPAIKLLDMQNIDGSDNLRIVARYSGGVRQGIGADIVLVS